MKNTLQKIVLFLIAIYSFGLSSLYAQVPDAINFQAIARDADGEVMANTNIQLRLTILEGAADGTEVYQELRALTTNDYGSFSFQIGRDANYITVGTFDEIDWAGNSKFLKIDYDPTNTFTFDLSLGTIEFVSVPYAFAAGDVTYIDLTGVQNGDVLVYNETTGKFEPGQVAGGDVDWADIQNTPNFASWDQDASDDFSGSYNDLTDVPANMDTDATDDFSGDYNDLANQPDFTNWDTDETDDFNGDYGSLSNTPVLISDFTMDASAANITNLADPVDEQDAATKSYVDELLTRIEALEESDLLNNGFSDSRDGNHYNAVRIGEQIWMAENLKYLPSVVGPGTLSETTAYYYVYGYDGTNVTDAKATTNYDTYGVLYNWPASMAGATSSSTNPSGVQGVCPSGWHLPSDNEWKELEMELGMSQAEADDTGQRGTNEGSKLAGNSTLWVSGSLENDIEFGSSGFLALPGSALHSSGVFDYLNYWGVWWTTTEEDVTKSCCRQLYHDLSNVTRLSPDKKSAFSVRCVRD
jgi:uncharacterized protein (TIGR02145 family)